MAILALNDPLEGVSLAPTSFPISSHEDTATAKF